MRAAPVNHAASRQVVSPIQTSPIADAAGTQAAHPDNSAAASRPSQRTPVSARDRNMQRRLIDEMVTEDFKRLKTGHPNRLFGAGVSSLSHPALIDNFVAQMNAVNADWAEKSSEEKIEHFQNVITGHFEAAGMPPPRIKLMEPGGGRSGEFDSKTWSMGMTAENLETRSMAETAGTAYHESRHAQQFFMIAKYIAQEGIPPPHSKQIPDDILEKATLAVKESPMSPAESAEAASYHTSVYGADREKRNATLRNLALHTPARLLQTGAEFSNAKAAHEAALATLETYKGEQTPEFNERRELREQDRTYMGLFETKKTAAKEFNRALAATNAEKVAFDAAQKAYHALPEEADAFAVGDAVTAKLSVPAST